MQLILVESIPNHHYEFLLLDSTFALRLLVTLHLLVISGAFLRNSLTSADSDKCEDWPEISFIVASLKILIGYDARH